MWLKGKLNDISLDSDLEYKKVNEKINRERLKERVIAYFFYLYKEKIEKYKCIKQKYLINNKF